MSLHTCHAIGCFSACAPEKLMCRSHWDKVPKHLKLAVVDAYRPGQCDDKRPSREWVKAADAAIRFVARLEKKAYA